MRILSVSHAYPRWGGDVAGAFIERLFIALKAKRHSITVVAPADQGNGGVVEQNGIRVRRVRYAPASMETLAYRGHMAGALQSFGGLCTFSSLLATNTNALVDEMRRCPADLVHAHWWVPGGIAAWAACLVGHKPYVVTLHGTDGAILSSSKYAASIARKVLLGAARVTTVSSHLADIVASTTGLDRSAIKIQPMPLEVDKYSRISVGGGGVVVVGRLTQQKNLGVVLEAMALLKREGRERQLTVIGDGPERRSLEYRAQQLGIGDSSSFLGAIPPEEVPGAIGDADVLAFPAVGEGLGLVVAEALMLGVPVIASKQGGGVLDLVPENQAGCLVDANSASQFASTIDSFLNNNQARETAAKEGQLLKTQLSPEFAAEVFDRVYAEVQGGV